MKFKSLRASAATRLSPLSLAVAVSALLHSQVHAQTWDGGGADTNWSTPENWISDTAPVAGEALIFAGTVQTTNTNDFAADTSFGGLSFTNTLDGESFSLSGNRITLGGNIVTTVADTAPASITDTIDLDLVLDGDRTITTNARHSLIVSGVISEDATSRSLTKTGAATLTLTGTNTYTGGTVISAGNIILANAGSGETIQGPITLSGGRLILGKSNQISDTSVITFASGANSSRFQLTNTAGTGYNETIAGLSDAAGTFTGTRLVESANDGFSDSPGTLTINTAGQSYAFGGQVRNAAGGATNSALSIVKDGVGIQTFSGNVSYSGSTTVKAGILRLTGANSVLANSAISLEGGTIEFGGGGATGTRTIAITSTSSAGGVTKSGTGTVIFEADNTYTGMTTVNNGTLRLNRIGGTLADSSSLRATTDTAILDVAQSDTVANLEFANAATMTGAGTLTVTNSIIANIAINKTNTIGASLAGDAYLRKSGQGTTVLSAANSYTGGTNLRGDNSKLTINDAGTLGSTSGVLSIQHANAVLDLGGTSQTVGLVNAIGTVTNGTLNVSTQLSVGVTVFAADPGSAASVAIGTATFNNLTMDAASTYLFDLEGGTGNADLANITGALTITSGAILDLVQDGTYTFGNKFTLFAYTAAEGLTGTFDGLADGATFTDAGGDWIIDYADTSAGLNGGTGDRFVTITAISGSGGDFSSWITDPAFGLAPEDQGVNADPDHDGMVNLLEYALNGNPSVSDSSILPDLVVTATDFEFTYSRLDLSLADTVQSFEYGSNLIGWTPIVIPAETGVTAVGIATVTVTDAGSTDTVKISIPKTAAADGKLFGRLQVVK